MASQDPRPVNPLMMGERQIYVFNPSTRKVEKEPLKDFFDYIPARVVQCRVFTLNHDHDRELAEIVDKVLGHPGRQHQDERLMSQIASRSRQPVRTSRSTLRMTAAGHRREAACLLEPGIGNKH